jgi:hypothetical protein
MGSTQPLQHMIASLRVPILSSQQLRSGRSSESKCRFFAWLILCNKALTADNMSKKQ